MSEKALRILRGDRIERAAHRFNQYLPASALCFSQYAFYLAEAFLHGVSMRRHILSRANVVASEATPSTEYPTRYVSIRTLFKPIKEARCSLGSV